MWPDEISESTKTTKAMMISVVVLQSADEPGLAAVQCHFWCCSVRFGGSVN